VEIYELSVAQVWDGRRLNELLPAENCQAVSITRGGKANVPEKETLLMAGDLVLVSATLAGIQCLRDRLNEVKE